MKKMNLKGILLGALMILSACSSASPEIAITTVPTQTALVLVPASGKAIMSGLLSTQGGTPMSNVPVRLAQVYRQGEEGAFVLDLSHSPSAITDENGFFYILEIPPAEYLVVIGRPEENNYIIYQDTEGKPYTYQISADQVYKIGELRADYSP